VILVNKEERGESKSQKDHETGRRALRVKTYVIELGEGLVTDGGIGEAVLGVSVEVNLLESSLGNSHCG